MSSKSSIKSKKQKINQKKFSKGNTPVLIQLISSSQDDRNVHSEQKIQKRSKYSGKNFNNSISDDANTNKYTPNNLNFDRIRSSQFQTKGLADRLLKISNQQSKSDNQTVLVVEQPTATSNLNQDRSLFSYKVVGVEGIKYISQSHCVGRIQSEIKNMEKKQQQKQIQLMQRICNGSFLSDQVGIDDQKNDKQEKDKEADMKQRKKVPRYFQEQLSDDDFDGQKMIKCFRCNTYGHIAKNCMQQEPKIQCTFCLQEHHQSVCQSSPCFKCCLPGHISKDCTSKSIQCRKCNKRGHIAEKCGIYIPLQYHDKNEQQIKKRFKMSDLKSLKCLNFCQKPHGHFNCFTYNSKKNLAPYKQSHDYKGQKKKWDDGY